MNIKIETIKMKQGQFHQIFDNPVIIIPIEYLIVVNFHMNEQDNMELPVNNRVSVIGI
jgi:hypothetical protein